MRFFSHVMLIGAVVLFIHFQRTDAFTLDRNVIVNADDQDSLETTTDLSLDNKMHNQNITSTEDDLDTLGDSTEVNSRLITQNFQPDVNVGKDSLEKLPIEDDRIDSVENLKNETSTEDHLDITNDSLEIKGNLIKRNIPISLNQAHDQLFDFDSTEDLAVTVPDISEEIQSTTTDDDLFDDLLDSRELVTQRTSTEDLADANDNASFESDLLKDVSLSTVSVFDHLPVIGVFSHPASDDLFIVKQYMGDYYLREMGDESAKDYFTQPAKGVTNFDFNSPERVNAARFATFTPVRSLPNQRLKTVF